MILRKACLLEMSAETRDVPYPLTAAERPVLVTERHDVPGDGLAQGRDAPRSGAEAVLTSAQPR